MTSKIVDGAIICLIILIPLLMITHHLLAVYFNLIYDYNQLAILYYSKTKIDKSLPAVYWFGFNMINKVSQAIMLDIILYIIFVLFIIFSVLVYVYYIKSNWSEE